MEPRGDTLDRVTVGSPSRLNGLQSATLEGVEVKNAH